MLDNYRKKFLLVDLPVFPKGVMALSLPLLAGYLGKHFEVEVVDANLYDWQYFDISTKLTTVSFIGIKVSAQSFEYAKQLTQQIKQQYPNKPIIWGGELPTLLPETCLQYADCVIKKRIEGCIDEFVDDLKNNCQVDG